MALVYRYAAAEIPQATSPLNVGFVITQMWKKHCLWSWFLTSPAQQLLQGQFVDLL